METFKPGDILISHNNDERQRRFVVIKSFDDGSFDMVLYSSFDKYTKYYNDGRIDIGEAPLYHRTSQDGYTNIGVLNFQNIYQWNTFHCPERNID